MGGQVHLNVKLLAHTQLSKWFLNENIESYLRNSELRWATDGQIVALTAIRTCYSPNKPTEILIIEGERYFGRDATDGGGGTEADRLFRQIVASKHTSTLEHLAFVFAVEGVSRACLAQLTRHRIGFSYSVQSQRHVKFGSGNKTGGFDYVVPPSIENCEKEFWKIGTAKQIFERVMEIIQDAYDDLRELGVPAEDARMILPQAAATNITLTINLRALLDFYSKRRKGSGAQWEIAELAERLREEVVKVEPWLDTFFEEVHKECT